MAVLQKLNCSSAERLDDLQGRLWIRLWLQQLKGNPLRIRSLRELLAKKRHCLLHVRRIIM